MSSETTTPSMFGNEYYSAPLLKQPLRLQTHPITLGVVNHVLNAGSYRWHLPINCNWTLIHYEQACYYYEGSQSVRHFDLSFLLNHWCVYKDTISHARNNYLLITQRIAPYKYRTRYSLRDSRSSSHRTYSTINSYKDLTLKQYRKYHTDYKTWKLNQALLAITLKYL